MPRALRSAKTVVGALSPKKKIVKQSKPTIKRVSKSTSTLNSKSFRIEIESA
jgi:hypothetical protein